MKRNISYLIEGGFLTKQAAKDKQDSSVSGYKGTFIQRYKEGSIYYWGIYYSVYK